MKTKLLIAFLLISNWCFSQLWAPVGAEWYYDLTFAFHRDIDYARVYCDSTILFYGKNCQKINIDLCVCNNHFCKKLYSYKSQDTIFFYNEDVDSFEVLYNFNSQPGDFWQIRMKDFNNIIDTVTVVVDSIGFRNVNNKIFKSLYVSYNYEFKFRGGSTFSYIDKSEIVESLGDINLVINILRKSSFVCDDSNLYSLRCYKDSLVGLYSTGLRKTCDYTYKWVGIDDNSNPENILIYPNPASNILHIQSQYLSANHYELNDITGSTIREGFGNEIDLTNVDPGTYILKIQSSDKRFKIEKIIKHIP